MDRHGELSNAPVPRVLVHVDVFAPIPEVEKDAPAETFLGKVRKALHIEQHRAPERSFDTFALSALWQFSARNNVVLEAFADEEACGMNQDDLDTLLERLDEVRSHPLRAGSVYPALQVLVKDLPYRQDVMGVIDLPERGLRYGSWWIDVRRV